MKKHIKYAQLMIVAVLCLHVLSGQARAMTTTIYDNVTEFGWSTTPKHNSDTNGPAPDIRKIDVTWDDSTGKLQRIVVSTNNSFYSPSGLFLNVDYKGSANDNVNASVNFANLQQWDWYVSRNAGAENRPYDNVSYVDNAGKHGNIVPGNGLFEVNGSFDPNTGYTYATGSSTREGHVNGINAGALDYVDGGSMGDRNSLYGSGFWAGVDPDDPMSYIYDFTMLDTDVFLGENFVLGYTEWCANDVVLGIGTTGISTPPYMPPPYTPPYTPPTPSPVAPTVPEPTTLSLCGIGLVAFAGWKARSAKK